MDCGALFPLRKWTPGEESGQDSCGSFNTHTTCQPLPSKGRGGSREVVLGRSLVSPWGNLLFVSLASTLDNMCYLMPVLEGTQAAT